MMNEKEREVALRKMEETSSAFYASAVKIGNHPFIEFCGLMSEYIKACHDAHLRGEDFSECNTHSGQDLWLESFRVNYINEKLECIFTGRSVMASTPNYMDTKDQIHNLQQLCTKLLKELQSRIQARAESNLPEWEDHAARLGVNVPRDPRRSRLLPEADTILCSHCANGQVLELRVQLDQKVYQPCFCAGNTIDKLSRAVFAEGYKRATEDSQQKS